MSLLSLLQQKEQMLQRTWGNYLSLPSCEHFLEFVLQLNNLADALSTLALSGPLQECRRLETESMDLFGENVQHPIPQEWIETFTTRVERFCRLLKYYSDERLKMQERQTDQQSSETKSDAHGEQVTLIGSVGEQGARWQELVRQLGYFGFLVRESIWKTPEVNEFDLGIYLVDLEGHAEDEWSNLLKLLREHRPMARIICLSVPNQFTSLNLALKSGADHCMTRDASLQYILEHVLSYNSDPEQESYRVLVVEDSRTMACAIRDCLESYGIVTQLLYDPLQTLDAIHQFMPDLILMDMYMPGCTGVEVSRVVRMHEEFLGIPIVYLSSETNVGLQVEALRLGGDQFLTKPFHPVLMNAVIRSKIDRYRALRRTMQNDSLTGLLNHISSKQALASAMRADENESIAIVMMDLDYFKHVNDQHGHMVGDQVIRSLSWLLRQRLRASDVIGRYGGEEFIIGLIGARPENVDEIINRIREDFSKISFKGVDDSIFRVTLSAGIALRTQARENLSVLLEAADSALYAAKREGRNRVVIYTS